MKNLTTARLTFTLNHKKYPCLLSPSGKDTTHVECKAALIDQDFLNQDVTDLLLDLPNLVLAEQEHKLKQSEVIRFRVSPEDRIAIEKRAAKEGYDSISGFLRDMALGA
jgi:predicted DNA binding CopG/RHH family protein